MIGHPAPSYRTPHAPFLTPPSSPVPPLLALFPPPPPPSAPLPLRPPQSITESISGPVRTSEPESRVLGTATLWPDYPVPGSVTLELEAAPGGSWTPGAVVHWALMTPLQVGACV